MNTIAHTWRRFLQLKLQLGRPRPAIRVIGVPAQERPIHAEAPAVEIAPNDPLIALLQSAGGALDLDTRELDSPARTALRAAGVKLVVPLVSQGELIGVLNLGPRLSDQEYSSDDRKLLENLAAQAAPAVRVAQLVREQAAQAQARQRMEQELEVARLIQQHFLPKQVPALDGWHLGAYYRPAREVGGDFYDFIELPDGLVGIVIGDVTDKGVPAALVMAATRSVLRATAQRLVSPGAVLLHVNELIYPDTPPNMFVTCLYAVLDPTSGHLRYANAGHDTPYVHTRTGVVELRARGMPLGAMPDMVYEEREADLALGDHVVFYSDGLVEAHNSQRQMFGFPHLKELVKDHVGGEAVIGDLLDELDRFTGSGWEQEDDVTLVTLKRDATQRRVLAEFSLASEPGNERLAMQRVVQAVAALDLPAPRIEKLKTAVAEATMNAIEHGNGNRPELPVQIRVSTQGRDLLVTVTDQGGPRPIPQPAVPDLEAKLAGLQQPRGWGLFLIRNMVDDFSTTSDAEHHTISLTLHLEEGGE
jgi:serine phosphatase RsbU (regulator of sigma subunit)/anti-sigma regulatory factor (Ser/Thr protein kinase)